VKRPAQKKSWCCVSGGVEQASRAKRLALSAPRQRDSPETESDNGKETVKKQRRQGSFVLKTHKSGMAVMKKYQI